MLHFFPDDKDVRLIGAGGNSRVYILQREYNEMPSAIIKVPKGFHDTRVLKAMENYQLLQQNDIKTTSFLEKCVFNRLPALITENLHHDDYTYLDANAHLQTEKDILLKSLKDACGLKCSPEEPEEERRFADSKFEAITNLKSFVDDHLLLLRRISDENIYLPYDSYFFRVKREKKTDIDYMIADWDDVQSCEDYNLFEKNKDQFKTALTQFVGLFVEEGVSRECSKYLSHL